MVTLPNNFMGSVDAEWTVTQDGQAVAQAHLDGATLVLDVADGTRQHVEPESDGTYLVTLAGQTYRWSFDGGGEVIVTMQQGDDPDSAVAVVTQGSAAPVITPLNDASPSPSVTCVTTTPEPSASATPSAVPTPAATSNPVSDGSPFQCGFPINGDFIADGLTIGDSKWGPSAEINAWLADKYGDMDPLPQAAGSDDVVTMTVSSSHLEELGDSSSGWSQRDPVTSAELDAPQADLPLEEFGLTFAAVVDGKIVGTVGEGPWTANPFVWTDSDAAYSMDLTYLNPENAMTYCDGYGPNDDADLYLIAGTVTINAGGSTTTPIYSWKQVTPAP
jgi:hypothetical protein